jgi:hypothetical protein
MEAELVFVHSFLLHTREQLEKTVASFTFVGKAVGVIEG